MTFLADHDSIKKIAKLADSARKLARWRLRLSEIASDVVHRASKKRQAADALSRLQTTGENNTTLRNDLLLFAIDAKSDFTNKFAIDANSAKFILQNAQKENQIGKLSTF